MNLLAQYLPVLSELTPEQVQESLRTLRSLVQAQHPDIATNPGTPLGDLHLLPLAELLTALDVAVQRVAGDHDLSNIGNGKATLCDVASRFVDNFLPYTAGQRLATGYVRLTFSSGARVEIDRGTLIQFEDFADTGEAERSVLRLRLFHNGPAVLLPPGSVRAEGENHFLLRRASASSYICDVPVQGTMQGQIREGAGAKLNIDVAGLTNVRALFDFSHGSPETTLSERATRAQRSLYGSATGSRAGIQAILAAEFPDLLAASPIMTGDVEMTRATVNALGLVTPCLDICIKSNQAALLDASAIKLTYIDTQGGDSVRKFIGRLDLAAFPIYLEDIRASSLPTLDLKLGTTAVQVFARSVTARAPRASAAYSPGEELWICIDMPTSPSGADLLQVETETDGTPYAWFDVTYRYDPSIPVVSDYFQARANQLVNTSVVVKGFLPVVFSRFEVAYTRALGSEFNRQQAIDNIYDYMARLGFPYLFQEGHIQRIMHHAGADQVLRVSCEASLRFSLADRYLREQAPEPTEDYVGALADSVALPVINMSEAAQLNPTLRDFNVGTNNDSFVSVSRHNIAYLLDKSLIFVREEIV
jgi:hypothetical protein